MADLLPAIYRNDDGVPISTQSMLKTFRHCPKQAQYKYVERLKPKSLGKPLYQGDWMHKLFETHYKGGDWRTTHKHLSAKFGELFDEERDMLGDLPNECARIMRSYLWHYESDPWRVQDVEFMVEAELPNGHIFRVKIDLLVEDQFGLWLADHKFNAKLPDLNVRLLDIQSVMYVWAALRMGIPVNGFIWNYVRRKAPTVPELLKSGTRLSKKRVDTDYPTLLTSIRDYGLDWQDYRQQLRHLKSVRYQHGEPQTSTFFRRNHIERDPSVIRQVVREALHTSKRMHEYPFDRPDIVERHPDWMGCRNCTYQQICTLEVLGGDTRLLRKQRFEQVDPLYYYNDDPKQALVRGEE